MTLKQVLLKGMEILKNANIEAPVVDSGAILCQIVGCDRTFLYSHSDDIVDTDVKEKFFELLYRRSSGMPIQYITGRQKFMSLEFEVGPEVLIPRQDTEILVETVISICKRFSRAVKILDIGTGSGCIAISLAYIINNCHITATDISETALNTACRNAIKHKVVEKIEFLRSNLFSGLKKIKFDIIVSNPPYIRQDEIKTLQKEVRDYEPVEALDGGIDGLSFFREITAAAAGYLKPHGLLVFEVGYDQAEVVVQLMQDDYNEIIVIKDLAGIDRVVAGELKY